MKPSTDLEKKLSGINLTPETIEEIESLAANNYTVRQVAMFLDIPYNLLQLEFDNIDSEFRYHYDRGRLYVNALVDIKLSSLAQGDNLTAVQIFKKSQKETTLNNLKYELFGLR